MNTTLGRHAAPHLNPKRVPTHLHTRAPTPRGPVMFAASVNVTPGALRHAIVHHNVPAPAKRPLARLIPSAGGGDAAAVEQLHQEVGCSALEAEAQCFGGVGLGRGEVCVRQGGRECRVWLMGVEERL